MAEQGDAPIRGSGFNTDPQTGDWDQLSFQNHGLNEYVRGENTDTDDAFAIYVQGVSTTTKVFNVLKTGAMFGGSTAYAVLSATAGVTFGAAAAAGTGNAALRYDATLLLYDGNLPAAETFGSVGTTGSSSLAPRRDHVHPMPATPVTSLAASGNSALTGAVNLVAGAGVGLSQSGQGITLTASTAGVTSIAASGNSALVGAVLLYAGGGIGLSQTGQGIQITASTAVPAGASAGVPVVILGTTNAAGAIGTFLDVGSRIQLYDGTAPAAMTIGGALVQGGGSFAARSNHGHAIANTNVTLSGGSWGSGPIFDNPQIAATAWASANHTHLAGNTGGVITPGTTVVITYAESSTQFTTTSTSLVNITSLQIVPNISASANNVEYFLGGTVQTDAINTLTFQITNLLGPTAIKSFPFRPAAGGTQESMAIQRVVRQGTGVATVNAQMKIVAGNGYIGSGSPDFHTIISKEYR